MTRLPLPVHLLARLLSRERRDEVTGDLCELHRARCGRMPLPIAWIVTTADAAATVMRLAVADRLERVTADGFWPGVELRRAFRGLMRRPAQALIAVVTLGLGIAAVGTAFSIVWGTLLRGLPFEEAERLVHFERANPEAGRSSMAVTPHDYLDWKEAQRSFEDLGAYVEATALLSNPDAPPDRLVGVAISASSFSILRVEPALGRAFDASDELPGADDVILLSHDIWTTRYGSDPTLIGSQVDVGGRRTTVVGVMPAGFGFPIAEQFWTPLRLDLSRLLRGQGRLDVFGRLRPGVGIEEARTEFESITSRLAAAYPDSNAGVAAMLRSFREEYVGDEFAQTLYRMLAGAVLVMLICCANVANLLLLRGVRRREALRVRMYVGATARHVVGLLMSESCALATVGAALGVAGTVAGVAWFNRVGTGAGVFALPHGSDSLFWWNVSVDGPTLAAIVALTVVTAALAGLAPAVHAARATGVGRMRAEVGRGTGRITTVLVVAQITLACGLLVGTAFVTSSLRNVRSAESAFDGSNAWVVGVDLQSAGYPDHRRRLDFVDRLVQRLEAEPTLVAAAATTDVPLELPLSLPFRTDPVVEGGEEALEASVVSVSSGYFDVFGVAPVAGRVFDSGDGADGAPVALVNEAFLERYGPESAIVGTRIRVGDDADHQPWAVIVGVVPTLWESPRARAREAGIYFPMAQSGMGEPELRLGGLGLRYPTLTVRGREGAVGVAEVVRTAVFAQDAAVAVRDLRPMAELIERRMARYRVWGRFYLVFGGVALLLAALGIYGVLSFGVSVRAAEIGLRRALGASAGSVQREVVWMSTKSVGLGLVGGLWLGATLVRGLTRVLYGVEIADVRVFVAVAALLAGVGIVSSWLPARRAARIDPMATLRGGP